MSVQSHFDSLASNLVLSESEKSKITTSVDTISTRINSYFASDVTNHFKFGSSTRGTILPRNTDKNSDIDYMVIFKNEDNYKPQTLLNRLKSFAQHYYNNSEIHQSHPTMVLELQHIKFELVPAIKDAWGTIYIPSHASDFTEWTSTDPSGFNATLTEKNTSHNNKIKPLVRLMKYWNALNGYYLSSYGLEKWITDNFYFSCSSLKDYVYSTFESLNYNWNDPQNYKNKVDRAKKIIEDTKKFESDNMPYTAEAEIKKIFPEF